MVKKQSQFDVGGTLDRLEVMLKEKGVNPIARVDHAAAAISLGMELRPTEVLFIGNPKLGTPLMQGNQMAGLDLPMRVLAWEAEDGRTWIGYHSPQSIVDRLNMPNLADIANKMMAALDELTDIAIGKA